MSWLRSGSGMDVHTTDPDARIHRSRAPPPRSGQAERPAGDRNGDGRGEPQEQVPPPFDDRDAGDDRQPRQADDEGRPTIRGPDHVIDGRKGGEDCGAYELVELVG